MDRNQLEQEAMQQLNRGNTDAALQAYLGILKLDAKDRRIRQKVAELLLKIGRPQDAERHFREVADALLREGAHLAAVSVLKQLVILRPDEPAVQLELGECYVASGYPNDARQHFDAAMRLWLTVGKPLDAAKAARRLAEQNPGDAPARLKIAELLEAGGDVAGAGAVYQEVAEEYRRRGRADEVGRIAEMALRLRPEDVGLLLDAAAARVEAADWKRALAHLQLAFAAAPKEARTLDLLARTFEGVGQTDKALKVLTELSRVAAERKDVAMEADALRRATRFAPDDVGMRIRLSAADEQLSRLERRLTSLVLSQAATEDDLRPQVRAEVYARYGFPDRAEAVLRAALEARPDSLPLMASFAEILVTLGRTDDALGWMERVLPRAGPEADPVLDRMAVIKGVGAPAPAVPEPVAPVAAAAPAPPPPAAPPPAAPHEDPDDAFSDFGLEEGTYAEVSPDALDDVSPGDMDEARALVAVGMFSDALAMVGRLETLEAAVVRAQATRGLGDTLGAVDALRAAVNEAAEDDPAYCDALFELSSLYTATGKHRSASRLLEELKDLDPAFRANEVDARLRGLMKILK